MPKPKEEELELEEEVKTEDLEKALDNALEELGKAKAPDFEEEDEEEEAEEEETAKLPKKKIAKKSKTKEPDFESLSKSLSESLEEDEEASDVLNGIPFVKAMMDSLDDQISEMIKAVIFLSDKIDDIDERLEKSGKVNFVQAKLVKSISQTVREMGETSQPLKSYLGKNVNFKILRKGEDGKETPVDMSKSQALEKLTELRKAGKIDLKDVIIYESRIQKGVDLPEPLIKLLSEKAS